MSTKLSPITSKSIEKTNRLRYEKKRQYDGSSAMYPIEKT